ncbi:MAG: uroporphyrinogen decarboxylase family protein [Planctomycetota bacterium]|nr:uroporphyrinogen decarboxylase family protein [Planctomycetota bacterium]
MTGKERIERTLSGQSTDIVPRTPILMRYGAEYIGSNYGSFASDFNILVEATHRTAIDFGYDQVSVISDPYRETQGFGAEIQFVTDGVPRCVKHPLEDDPDLGKLLKPDPLKSARMLDRVRAVGKLEQVAGDYSILGWVEGPAAEATDLRNAEPFLIDLIDDEDYATELMDITLENAIRFARAQIEAGCDMVGMGDAIASQVGPALYEELIQPREKRLVQAIKAMGAKVKIHICGDITPLLPGLADIAPDVLDCDHMVSLEKARKIMPSGTVLTGNLDPANDMLLDSPEAIRAKVEQAYREAGNPYFVNAGCEIPSGTPAENLKALCEPLPYRN